MMKKVSIIINCYNGEQYLKEAIESVRSQTYQNFELILWDNLSTDRSAEIFKSYSDHRFRYHKAVSHTNLYQARNLAIGVTTGDYVAFLDADDMWIEEKLELQVAKIIESKANLVYGNFIVQKEGKKYKKFKKVMPSGDIHNYLLNHYVVGILTVLFKKEIFDYDMFSNDYHMIGDFDLIIRLSRKYKFAAIQNPLAIYRIHGNNESIVKPDLYIREMSKWYQSNVNDINNLKSVKEIINFEIFKKYIVENNKNEALKSALRLRSFYSIYKAVLLLTIPKSIIKAIRKI